MRRPARVCDTDIARQRLGHKVLAQIDELARGAPPLDRAVEHGRDAGRIIAPIFEPSQSVEQPLGDIVLADDPDNSAHAISPPSWLSSVRGISPPRDRKSTRLNSSH